MKVKFAFFTIIIMFAFSTLSFGQTQVPNGTFENWTDTVSAASWNSNNYSVGGFLNYYFVHRSSSAHGGTYAAKVETLTIPVLGAMGGILTLGSYSVLSGFSGGQPITGKPIKLSGYFKYAPVSGDTMAVIVVMTKWNGTSRDTLFYNGMMSSSTVSAYTLFQIPISYNPSTATPDSMNIIAISSAGSAPQVGSALYLDDLTFAYSAGVEETQADAIMSVFPNPTTGNVNVLLNGESNTVAVYNILGETIYSQNTSSKNLNIDLSSFENGIYLLEVNKGNNRYFRKLVLSK
jgi:hypothetical protein